MISTTKNSFKIALPNVNAKYEVKTVPASIENIPPVPASKADRNEQRILIYVREHGAITRPEVEELLGISASTASRLIKKMVWSGLLVQDGKARNSRYMFAE